ncbi:hypothetical protein ACFLRQ_01625 [Bacteroidota bacterium]
MKKRILVVFLSFILGSLYAQQNGISITGGIGAYNMQDLRNYQDELITRMPVNVEGLSYFPSYTNIRLNLFRQYSNGLKYGLVFAYAATGAHANYKDNSGSLNLDQTISAYRLGISASYQLLQFKAINFMAYGDLGIGYIRDNVNMVISTNYYYTNNTLILSTFSPQAELGIEALYNINNISLGIEGGYLFDIGNEFKYGNQSLPNPNISLLPTSDYKSELSGFRLGLKFIFWFTNSSQND